MKAGVLNQAYMKKSSKSKRQIAKEYQLERGKKKKEFEAKYYRQTEFLTQDEIFNWSSLPTLEQFVEEKLNEWDYEQLKIPSGKYQDKKKIASTYQQKFVEYMRELCPQVIEELREFTPYFERLFGEQKDKYIYIFDNGKGEILFDLKSSLDSKINFFLIKDNFLQLGQNDNQNWRIDYHWGEYRLLLHFLYFLFLPRESTDKKDEVMQDTFQLLQKNLVNKRGIAERSNETDESIFRDDVIRLTGEILKEILVSEEHKFHLEEVKRKIIEFLQGISPTPSTSIFDFIKLQIELLKWAERHNLEKDWLLRYAHFFLFQFSNNPNTKLVDLEIPFLAARSFEGHPFEIKFNGWLVRDEDSKDYEKKVIEKVKSELERYFHNVSNQFDLDNQPKVTKPPTFEKVKWLVYSTVKGWRVERIVEKFFPDIAANKTNNKSSYFDYENKLKHIKSEMKELCVFDLPVKENL